MTSAEPVRPASSSGPPGVQASVLACLQLVEDARYRVPEHVRRRQRARARAARAVAARRVALEFERD